MRLPSSHSLWVRLASALFVVTSALAQDAWSQPEEPRIVAQQIREFRVSVDNKVRGNQVMTLSRRSDGSEMMSGEVEVMMNLVVYRYRYASSGTEIWKNGRLIQLINESNYNGDKYVIQGSATKQSLDYEVNGEAHRAPPDIWAASYWREPDPRKIGQNIHVLDSDKGRQLTATLERLDPENLTFDAGTIKTSHYRLRGDVEVDVWYDKFGLIVRQELMESGHRTLLDLTKVRKPEAQAEAPKALPR